MEKEDYYKLLDVTREASSDEIKKAYRKKALKYHPDKNKGDKGAEEKFKQVSEAYEILMDTNKRAAYDRFGHQAFQQGGVGKGGSQGFGGFHDPMDIFRDFFGGAQGNSGGSIFDDLFGGQGGGSSGGATRGSDLRYDLEITLEEAASGIEKEISFRRAAECEGCNGSGAAAGSSKVRCNTCNGSGQVTMTQGFFSVRQKCHKCNGNGVTIDKPCPKCSGEGRIMKTSKVFLKIPAGVDTGSKLRSTGQGEAGVMGGPSGDLYVIIHVKEHKIFERHEDDLYCEISIKFTLATLGGSITVPTLTKSATLKIPEGTQTGTLFRVRNQGIKNLRSGRAGDQLVRVQIEVPKKLSSKQRKILEEFAKECGDADSDSDSSVFKKAKRFF